MKCFLAAHGTGKTTLIKEIQRISNIYVTDAFSRPIKQASSILSLIDGRTLTEIQQQVLNFELMKWAQDNYYDQNVLTTRSLFDSLIFARLLTPEYDTTKITQELEKNQHRIKKIFYLPIEFEMEDDGVRYDYTVQRRYDDEIHRVIDEFCLKQIIVLRGSIEQRLEKMKIHL